MKSSFSLSSLRSAPAPPGGRCDQLERPYHSLTKKRKEPCREAWRRSWGSAASGGSAGDDLWPLLQHHYDYIMDNQIIDSCKEANGELLHSSVQCPRLLNPTAGFNRQWSLSQLVAEFNELCQWLSQVQEEIYSSPENLSRFNRQWSLSQLVAEFNELCQRLSQVQEEIYSSPENLSSRKLRMLVAEFNELCQWLSHVQEEIYSSPENLSSRKLRMSRMTELVSVEPRRAKFIEQATAILERIPEASAEVTWRIEHLNVKWEGLRLLLSPEQQHREGDSSDTVG
ncbi:hypothetical protein B5X24_HaOG202696 [Helicoverpa armigera]|uniref:Uncharacterized protein n=1 Tax=Helicoverpa armigera TaxID=29058 RepID=A0A2W1BWM3_HELAM|nr:hypothetical protein B5X24_HaOG202696 [Helicoverpa armigera]